MTSDKTRKKFERWCILGPEGDETDVPLVIGESAHDAWACFDRILASADLELDDDERSSYRAVRCTVEVLEG